MKQRFAVVNLKALFEMFEIDPFKKAGDSGVNR